MKVAVLTVTAIGIAIGLSAPHGQRAAPTAAATAPSLAVVATPTPRPAFSPSPVATWSPDTTLTRDPSGHFFADADVNGTSVHFVVDTGASTVALTEDDARRAGIEFDESRFAVVGSGASGDVRGQVVELRDVVLDGKRVDGLEGMVLEGLTVSLLGQNYLRRLDSVAINGDVMTLK